MILRTSGVLPAAITLATVPQTCTPFSDPQGHAAPDVQQTIKIVRTSLVPLAKANTPKTVPPGPIITSQSTPPPNPPAVPVPLVIASRNSNPVWVAATGATGIPPVVVLALY